MDIDDVEMASASDHDAPDVTGQPLNDANHFTDDEIQAIAREHPNFIVVQLLIHRLRNAQEKYVASVKEALNQIQVN
ncbi:hypothetical protein ONZ45_g9458 [Pleurotus djamor]|nr:hypothetical protein ONZ45_g9458 [Pleurotus djamor]